MPRVACASVLLTCALFTSDAGATYSIVATDPVTGATGAAGASCVPYEVIRILGDVPGRGTFVAQAEFDDAAFAEALELFARGANAAEALARVTDARAFPKAHAMQYGFADAAGNIASATGDEATPIALDRRGRVGELGYAALGNYLTSDAVVDAMGEAFEADACDLAERLMNAIEAAGRGGEGDRRCTPSGFAASSAFIAVSDARGPLVRISIPDVSPGDPVLALREAFEHHREERPCSPVPNGEGGQAQAPPPKQDLDAEAGGCSVEASGRRAGAWLLGLAAAAYLRAAPRARAARSRRRVRCCT